MAPCLLRQRLGHLDPARIARDPESVRVAIASPPKLHRYIDKMPGWLAVAAQRVIDLYGGDASAIWANAPREVWCFELQRQRRALRSEATTAWRPMAGGEPTGPASVRGSRASTTNESEEEACPKSLPTSMGCFARCTTLVSPLP